jgi:hypothetical protein
MVKKVLLFYFEGFRSMTLGRKLWMIILIKLFIMFVVLKIFFFHNFLNSKYNDNQGKSNYVLKQLTN